MITRYRVRKQNWHWLLKDSRNNIFKPTKIQMVPFKRCIYLEFKTKLGLLVAFLVSEKMNITWGPLEIQNAQWAASPRGQQRVYEAFNSSNKQQIRWPNQWCESKDIHLSWFQLIRPLKVIKNIALNVWKSRSEGIFTVLMLIKVSIGSLVLHF